MATSYDRYEASGQKVRREMLEALANPKTPRPNVNQVGPGAETAPTKNPAMGYGTASMGKRARGAGRGGY